MSKFFGPESSSVRPSVPVPPGDAPPPPRMEDGSIAFRPLPLLLMRMLPGVNEMPDNLAEGVRMTNYALREGGALILPGCVEPLLLIYAGQVIRFDGYGEEDYTEEPDAPPTPARSPARPARETW